MVGILDFIPHMYQDDPRQAYISLLMISLPYRNTGLGGMVVGALEEHLAQTRGVTAMFASVQVNNPSAIRFWQRNGYWIISGPELQPDQTVVFHLQKNL
jgi:ribosomal protein S18 acetylase RimI-like enzyme